MKFLLTFLVFTISYLNVYAQIHEESIYQVVEDMPRFPGCEDEPNKHVREGCANKKMLSFLYENISYPEAARKNRTEGTVVVQFIIDKDGSIRDTKVAKDVGDGCSKETLRVISLMPDWIPGKQRGENVNVRYTLPVKFKLP